MNDFNIQEAEEALQATRTISVEGNASKMDTGREVEISLTHLLKHQIGKIQKNVEFEDQIKQAIITRLAEADFGELIHVLGMVQGTSNDAVGKILLPFIPKTERVPLLDSEKNKEANKDAGEIAFENAPKEVLQSLGELSRLLKLVKSPEPTSGDGGSITEESKD